MKIQKLIILAGLMLAALFGVNAQAIEIIGDNFNVTSNLTGFALGQGVNSGINPPVTRLTGSAAANLRYIKTAGAKADSAHSINDQGKFRIARVATDSSTISLSSGTGAFDLSSVLNTLSATPELPAVYELTITIANAAAAAQRCSFAISSTIGTANAWDFAIQLNRPNTNDVGYTVHKRASLAASGLTTVLNDAITGGVGTYPDEVSFLFRVTDAGAEAAPSTNSRVEVAIVSGASTNWIYDTSADSAGLPNGWRFPNASRFIFFDIAGGAGPVTYDDFSLIFISGPAAGANRIWTGEGSDDNWSTAANWNGTAPSTGDTLVFDGTLRQANNNDITGLIVPWVTFNNGGFQLSGNTFSVSDAITNFAGNNTIFSGLEWESASQKVWNIASGSELILNNNTAVDVGGEHHFFGGGTLQVKGSFGIGQGGSTVNPAFVINEGKHVVDGGSFASRGGYRIGSMASGSGAQTILTNGANFTLTVAGGNLRVGDSVNPNTSRLLMDNSSLTMAGGSLGIPYAAGATGEVVQIGGSFSSGYIVFNDNGAGHGTYTVKDALLEPFQIRDDTAAGFSAIYMDNVTLKAGAVANAQFFSGVDIAEIQAGGLTLETIVDVTIAQKLSGSGSLSKTSFGTATLTGANDYSGNTFANTGKLVLPTTQTNAGIIQVADGAELGVTVRSQGSSLTAGGLSFNGGSFNILHIDLGTFSNPTAPLIGAPNLSVSGPVVIHVANGANLTIGQIVLIDYEGTISGGFQFTVGSLPSGVSATLINNTANSSIDLDITAVPGFRWTGANSGDWDTETQNWINLENGSPSTYANGLLVEFSDGAATGNVDLKISPSPSILIVNNDTLPYVWANGVITSSQLRKTGTNSLTRILGSETDAIGLIELNAGSYVVENSANVNFTSTVTNSAAGSGTFIKAGGGTLTNAVNISSFEGSIVIAHGTYVMGVAGTLGATNGTTTILPGATLELNNQTAPHEPVIVSGAGVDGLGAIIDSATATGVQHNLTDVTMVGDTTFGNPTGGRWDIRVRTQTGPGPGLRGNGFKLTKVGSGEMGIFCQRHFTETDQPYWEMDLGPVDIREGTLTFGASLTLGNPSEVITISPLATLDTSDLNVTNPILRNVFLTNGTISSSSGGSTNRFTGTIGLSGGGHFRANNSTLLMQGAVTGDGSLGISGSGNGVVVLNGASTFSGDTVVTNGTLRGTGSLAGNLIIIGGTVAPGNGVGTFTVNGDVTLANTTVMEIDRALSPNSDRLNVGGALSFGGILNVVLASGASAPQAGDVYQLFNKGSGSSFSAVNLPDISALPGGLSWDTSNLAVNGSISVTGTATQPTIGSVSVSGGNFVFEGTGGIEGGTYIVLSSTDVAVPVSNWTPIATNTFGAGGTFSYSQSMEGAPATFFLLQVP